MALTLLAANNAQSVLAASISSTATTLVLNTGTGDLFPSPVSGASFFKLTLVDAATGQLTEIVHVTARTGDTLTVDRHQEGTTSHAWSANDIAANMMTAGTLTYLLTNFQPLCATLTALAALATGADKLPYFTGSDTAGQTDLTAIGRGIIGKLTAAEVLSYLAAAPLADPTFTGTPKGPTSPVGTNTTQLATTAFVTAAVGSLGSYGSSGWRKNPDSTVEQWGIGVTGADGSVSITFPQPFTTAAYTISALISASTPAATVLNTAPMTLSGTVIYARTSAGAPAVGAGFYWRVLGK